MDLFAMYKGLCEELKFNPTWAVRVEQEDDPAGIVATHPSCWNDMPTPQAEIAPFGKYAGLFPKPIQDFVDSHGKFNCATNHDTFEEWWPLYAVVEAAGRGAQIAVIDLTETQHLRLTKQTLINRRYCTLVKVITLH